MLKRILAFHAECYRFARKQQRRNLRFKSKVLDHLQMDVLCLPYDFFLKLTGDRIYIVDDDGSPVEGVDVKLYGHSDAMMISNGLGALHDEVNGRSNKDGLFRTWRHLQDMPSLSLCMRKTGCYHVGGGREHLLDANGKIGQVAIKKLNDPHSVISEEDWGMRVRGKHRRPFLKGQWGIAV